MATVDTTTVPQGVNYFYVRTMLKAARPLLLHTQFAQVKDIPEGNGALIRFRRYSLLAVNTVALTQGVTPTGKSVTVTNVNATVLQYGDYITHTDFLSMTTLDPIATEFAELLGQQAGNSLDQLARDVMAAGTTIQYASTSTARDEVSASMKINRDEIKEAVRTLKGNNAAKLTSMVNPSTGFNTSPIRQAYVGICSEDTEYDLKDDPDWVPVEQYSSQKGIMEGEIGKLDEVRFISTTNAKVFSTSGAGSIDVHGTLILAADYYGISRIAGNALENIITPLGSAGSADPLKQRATQGWKASFVAMRLNENFCVRLEHAVSA